jgi:hypothetical protein
MCITDHYIAVRYGSDPGRLEDFRRQVERFDPGSIIKAG